MFLQRKESSRLVALFFIIVVGFISACAAAEDDRVDDDRANECATSTSMATSTQHCYSGCSDQGHDGTLVEAYVGTSPVNLHSPASIAANSAADAADVLRARLDQTLATPSRDGHQLDLSRVEDALLQQALFMKRQAELATAEQETPHAKQAKSGEGKASLQLHFATPIYRTNIRKFLEPAIADRVNEALAGHITDIWRQMLDTYLEADKPPDFLFAQLADAITLPGYKKLLDATQEMQVLKRFLDLNVVKFFTNLPGIDRRLPPGLKKKGNELNYWVSVKKWGMTGPARQQSAAADASRTALIVGWYFIRLPPLAGPLSFLNPNHMDPRGSFAFNKVSVAFEDGELILCPGWVRPSELVPTHGSSPSIVLGFSVEGGEDAWKSTANVNTRIVID